MSKQGIYWDTIAQAWSTKAYRNQIFAEHKRNTYLKLLKKWVNVAAPQIVLKTDLFDEAFYNEQYLFDTAWANCTVGMDISRDVVEKARHNAKFKKVNSNTYVCCDILALPFRDDCIDYVISDSTIDHFPSEENIVTSLREMSRVIKAGGVMVLILDNKSNLTYPPYFLIQLWMKLGLSPYFIGRTLSLKQLHKTFNSLGLTIVDSTAIFHYPHPDGMVRGVESIVHRICGNRLDNFMRRVFFSLERLENTRSRFLTGRYIALKVIKGK